MNPITQMLPLLALVFAAVCLLVASRLPPAATSKVTVRRTPVRSPER